MRVQGVARLLVLGVAMRKNNSAFPKPKHAFFFHQKRCAATHPWAMGPPTCKIVGVESMFVFVQPASMGVWLPVSKYPWIQLRREPPRSTDFHDDSSNVCSLGRSATADVAWRPLLDLPLQSKRNPMAALVNMYRYRVRGTVEIQRMPEEFVLGLYRKDV